MFPDSPIDVFQILKLSHDYKIFDLKIECEEDICNKFDISNILQSLKLLHKNRKIVSENLYEKCQSQFLQNFDKLQEIHPDIEKQLFKLDGLISLLFLNSMKSNSSGGGNSNTKSNRKRVSFFGLSDDIFNDTNSNLG